MSTITAYARARAVAAGAAQPIATVRHLHLAEHPLVVVPLALAGEANAPLAAMIGTTEADPTLLMVAQPRNRDQRFAFAAALADAVLPHIERCCASVEQVKDRTRSTDAPQLLVPNPAGIHFVRLLGRSTRLRRTAGPYAVPFRVPILGRWLTWFAERAEHPGSSTLLAITDAITMHWATGQSAVEDANLAALLSWLDPALVDPKLAEDPVVWPPAGPATDPGFDNEVLAPTIRAYEATEPDTPARLRAHAALEHALRGQLEPTWRLMWRAAAVLRALPAATTVSARWAADRQRFTDFAEYVAAGGLPQARRDGAVAAARRLATLEQAQARFDADRAFDDPLVMAAHRATGAAFAGTVTAVDRTRRVPNDNGNLVTRPLVEITTTDPVHLSPGTKVKAVSRPTQLGTVQSVAAQPDATVVALELSGGMGRAKIPPPGSVPEPGETLCYTSVLAENVPSAGLPATEDTPWTHGGPPQPTTPSDDDAREVWE